MTFDHLLVAIEDRIASVTINRPDKLNALNAGVLEDLDAAFSELAEHPEVGAIVLTGAGQKSFVAGADITQFKSLTKEEGTALARKGQRVFDRIEQMPKVVIAAVNGFALGGGCELAMACHIRIASENASFGQPEVNLGIIPGYGGTQRLPRLVGSGLAAEMILTGNRISAQRAYEIGLANQVVPAETLLEAARNMAGIILEKAPLAVEYSLEAIRSADGPLAKGLEGEAALFGQSLETEDAAEGVSAFLERRTASFKGR